jgi:hypothetical protein
VLFFELFPILITVVCTAIAIALFVVAVRRRGEPERPLEQRDPNRPDEDAGKRITRGSMRG